MKKTLKKMTTVILTVLLLFTLPACSSKTSREEPGADTSQPAKTQALEENNQDKEEGGDKEEILLRFSTSATGESITVQAMEVFKKEIEESTEGQIKIEIYHSSSLFAQDAEMEAVMTGNLDMATGGVSWLSAYVPELSMLSAAYIYESVEHQDAVLNGEIGKSLFGEVADITGVLPLAAWYGGARQLSLRMASPEIHTPEDMKGVILRMPNSADWLFLGEALGASPTPMAFAEIYTSLSTGTIDAQDNPLPILESSKCYEVTKQIVLTQHVLDSVWPAINKEKWDSLGPELQQKMMDAIKAGTDYAAEANRKSEEELLDFFREEGIVIVEPDLDAFMTFAEDKYLNSDIAKDWDMDLYRKIKELAR